MNSVSVATGLAALVLVYAYFRRSVRPSLSMIRGPRSRSFILGNLLELFQRPVGEADFAWQALYGNIVRFKGAFEEDYLLVTDPKALQKMLHTSAYTYVKPNNFRSIVYVLVGKDINWAEGEAHRRYKTIVSPGFGLSQSREFLPVIKECVASLSTEWLAIIGNSNEHRVVLDIRARLSRATLGALGQATFHVKPGGSSNDSSQSFIQKYENYFRNVFVVASPYQVFVQTASHYLPLRMLQWFADHVPHPRLNQIREFKSAIIDVAREIVQEKAETLLHAKDNRDVLTRLVKANMNAGAKDKLTEEELLTLITVFLLGAHEIIALSISWLLMELAKNPGAQSRLRDEIGKAEAMIRGRNDSELTCTDLDAMPYLNAVIKEGLRLHTVNPYTMRMATRDDTLPLSKPILTKHGETIDEVLVPKGTQIVVSIAAYNRDKDLWGEDAHVFNPDRWLNGAMDANKLPSIGAYSNILTFLGGARGCPGRHFAIVEIQAGLFELVGKFEFGTTDKTERVVRQFALNMVPMVEGEYDRGVQLPLTVSLAPV